MFYSKVCEDTYQMSDNLPNDRLFEGIWPTPNGVSVNAYLIEGADKYALIDGSTSWTGGLKKFKSDDGVEWDSLIESICEVDNSFEELKEVFKANNLDEKKIGYVIINHMEPDHSSWIESMYKINPDIEVYISERGSHILESFYSFKEKVNVVKDGDKLDIGNGHVLTFYEIPNVHWPDTMVTFDEKTGVVFACDAFGSYGAVDENNYDDLLSEEKIRFYEDEAIGYYSNIV
ncbi:MAG: MBL fold metallo-hydrolase, partial [Tissierellia bacterium]|nr:MBL fold metallo-hydrolase [Tissierellia bacterium]